MGCFFPLLWQGIFFGVCCRLSVVCFRLSVGGCLLLVVGCRLTVEGCLFSVGGSLDGSWGLLGLRANLWGSFLKKENYGLRTIH